jgi:signal transduction histidine kinase
MDKTLRIVVIEDKATDAELLIREVQRAGFTPEWRRVETEAEFLAELANAPDLILSDFSLPHFDGLRAVVLLRERGLDTPFLLISGKIGEEAAAAVMKAGADDYLFKGNLSRLVPAIQRELREADRRRQARLIAGELHQRELQLADAQRIAQLGTWHLDLLTGAGIWSDEACLILDRDPKQEPAALKDFLASLHPDDRSNFEKSLNTQGLVHITQDARLLLAQSAERFIQIRCEIIRNASGTATAATGMIQDITEGKRAADELYRLKEAAEAANRAKSEFLANMSHEIRTPMTAIAGFADMLVQPNPRNEDRAEYAQTIQRNVAHMLGLVNDILDLSKIETGRMTVERIDCDLQKMFTDITSVMRPRATERGLGFEVTFRTPIPRHIWMDTARLRQILINLVGNAVKFSATGQINLSVSSEGAGNILRVDITDTGIGLTLEQINLLFRPFAQAEECITRKFGGTGLGLVISQRFAELLGGRIEVKSQPGTGSTFTLRVVGESIVGTEMLDEVSKTISSKPAWPAGWQEIPLRGRILLIEDGRDNQRLMSTHLRASGAEVVIAENGQIGVNEATSSSFDLILMDMQMPVMDGHTATAELRRRGFTIPIIAITAFAMVEDRTKCIASGCTHYISKPIERENFLRTVSQYLGTSACALAVGTTIRAA